MSSFDQAYSGTLHVGTSRFPYYGGKQYTKVLVCDRNKCPEYRGFLYMEVKQYTKVLVWDRNKCP